MRCCWRLASFRPAAEHQTLLQALATGCDKAQQPSTDESNAGSSCRHRMPYTDSSLVPRRTWQWA